VLPLRLLVLVLVLVGVAAVPGKEVASRAAVTRASCWHSAPAQQRCICQSP
jgi:hypothetical protein